ncbi:hypothetical protein BDV96DRAFT_644365 [Lophiotrema nucula]|uniref:Fungal N-terminal domain-containing protein n=1 Tax=Lophiotrema nucula TaxID=690887 RepID=A0A6A5ZGJ0_9PLEO|nr:hypothetical protein BDV96DRAFT_644365 [Lophiotrema nucula]
MADALGTLATIGSLLKKAYDIYAGCKQAPEEIRLAAEHVHGMTLVLEDVRTNLVNNRRSYVHQKNNAMAQTQRHNLEKRVQHCERALIRTDNLLRKYKSFKHISGWQKFTWSTGGKAEIASCKEDLVMSLMLLDTYINAGNAGTLYRVERTLEIFMQRFEVLAGLQPVNPFTPTTGGRGRRTSNVGCVLVLSLIISRLRKALLRYRRRKPNSRNTGTGGRTIPKPTSKRPGTITRVPSGFNTYTTKPSFNTALGNYATSITSSPSTWSTSPQAGGKRAKTPDPYPRLGAPIRRSSSMSKLMTRINASAQRPRPTSSHYACYKIGIGSLAFGFKTAPQTVKYKRGQTQLRKMAAVFQESSAFDQRGLGEADKRVRMVLKARNEEEKKGGSAKRWKLVTARVVGRDPGRSGMVSVEKAVVIVARR